MKKIILKLIKLYQKILSPDHGFIFTGSINMRCRFYPSCSQYTYEAIEKLGLIQGISRGIKRILRCNPLSNGGIDRVI